MTRFLQLLKKRKPKDKDKVGKTMDIIALLQAIFAILLVGGKTLHEQSLLIARLSRVVSDMSAHPSPAGGLAVPQLTVLLPVPDQEV